MQRSICSLINCVWAAVFFVPMVAFSQLATSDYVDPFDMEYVRIKSPSTGQYLYEDPSSGSVLTQTGVDARDLRSHWYLKLTTNSGQYWIRNRLTGDSMNSEAQNGVVQVGAFQSTFVSHRWNPVPDSGETFFRIANVWKPSEYLMVPTGNGTLTYASSNNTASQQFVLENIPRGATLPWFTYDQSNSVLSNSATLLFATNYDKASVASETRNRTCILLGATNAAASWTVAESADSLNIRYCVADGASGTITLRITPSGSTNSTVVVVPVTSAQAWVYYNSSGTLTNVVQSGWTPMKRFNDVRVKLTSSVGPGDTLTLLCASGNIPAYIDCVEAETAVLINPPASYLNVKSAPYNAKGDGSNDDTSAFTSCLSAANSGSVKVVYVPPGRYNLSRYLSLPGNVTLQGGGMWKSELYFTNFNTVLNTAQGEQAGGFDANGNNIMVADLYIKGAGNIRGDTFNTFKGYWGTNSLIKNVWVEQTDVGAWIANYNASGIPTRGLTIFNCRFRNLFADGVNLARGSASSIIDNCHVRSAGDDGLAAWSSYDTSGASNNMDSNNILRYNTVECGDRASGIGIFGGQGHLIHHNVIQDQVNGSGIRFNTVFVTNGNTQIGYGFGTNGYIRCYQNSVLRTGNTDIYGDTNGAITLQTSMGNVANISLSNNTIGGAMTLGLLFSSQIDNGSLFTNIYIADLGIQNVSTGVSASSTYSAGLAYTNGLTFSNVATPVVDLATNFGFTPWNGSDPLQPVGIFTNVTVTPSSAAISSLQTQQFTAQASGSSGILTTNAPSFTWSVNGGGVISSNGLFTPASNSNGSFTITATASGLSGTASLTLSTATPAVLIIQPSVGTVMLPWIGDSLALSASATNFSTSPSLLWSQVSGSGTATFDNPSSSNPGVLFSSNGTYLLSLAASNGNYSASNTLSVTVGTPALSVSAGADIGSTGYAGSGSGTAVGAFTLTGSGADIWNTADAFHFLWTTNSGDAMLTARVATQQVTDPWAKAGVMIRQSTNAGSPHAFMAITGTNGLAMQWRSTLNGTSSNTNSGTNQSPYWVRLVRTGDVFTGYYSGDGVAWVQQGGSQTITMGSNVLTGLAVTSHNNGLLGTATFDHVTLSPSPYVAPQVGTGTSPTNVNINQSAALSGSLSNNGTGWAAVSTAWSQISGPSNGTALFANATSPATTVTFSQAGNYILRLSASDGYSGVFQNLSLSVSQPSQTISFPVIPDQSYGNGPVPLGATASSGLMVSYASSSTNISLSGGTVTILGAGTASIVASQTGNSNYLAATPVTNILVIAKAVPVYSIVSNSLSGTYSGSGIGVTLTNGGSIPVVITYNGSTNLPTGAGTYTVVATVGDTNNYSSYAVTNTLTIAKAGNTISSFTTIPTQTSSNHTPFPITSPTSSSGLSVTLSVLSGPASISGNTVTLTGTGTVILAANQAGNANYLAAVEVTTSFAVIPAAIPVDVHIHINGFTSFREDMDEGLLSPSLEGHPEKTSPKKFPVRGNNP